MYAALSNFVEKIGVFPVRKERISMIKRPLAVFGLLYMAMSALAVCFIADVNFTVAFMAALIGCAACFFAKSGGRWGR